MSEMRPFNPDYSKIEVHSCEAHSNENDGSVPMFESEHNKGGWKYFGMIGVVCFGFIMLYPSSHALLTNANQNNQATKDMIPFSLGSPMNTGMQSVLRPPNTRPLDVWETDKQSLPTNEWWESLAMGGNGDVELGPENFANALTYHVDVSDPNHRGLRVAVPTLSVQSVTNRFCQVIDCSTVDDESPMLSSDDAVVSTADPMFAVTMSDHSPVATRVHRIPSFGKLGVALTWSATSVAGEGIDIDHEEGAVAMSTPIVYGMSMATMEYYGDTLPLITAPQGLAAPLVVDGLRSMKPISELCLEMDDLKTTTNKKTFRVKESIEFQFLPSDHRWLLLVSEPMTFSCTTMTNTSFTLAAMPPVAPPPPKPTKPSHPSSAPSLHPTAFTSSTAAPSFQPTIEVTSTVDNIINAVNDTDDEHEDINGDVDDVDDDDDDDTAIDDDGTDDDDDDDSAQAREGSWMDESTSSPVASPTTNTKPLPNQILRLGLLTKCATGVGPECPNLNQQFNDDSNLSPEYQGNQDMGRQNSDPKLIARRNLLIKYSELYPTEQSAVSYKVNDGLNVGNLIFDWKYNHFRNHPSSKKKKVQPTKKKDSASSSASNGKVSQKGNDDDDDDDKDKDNLLMFGLQHHLIGLGKISTTRTNPKGTISMNDEGTAYELNDDDTLEASSSSSKDTQHADALCISTVRGSSCPILGKQWKMRINLPPNNFAVTQSPATGRLEGLNAALDQDLKYKPPKEFQLAAGSTYVGGKMLAKMARIALIAEELGRRHDAVTMANQLAEYLNVWLSPTDALSPFLYDEAWGGVVSCGCYFDPQNDKCFNEVSGTDCPCLYDLGQNFGQGFYQDHHFHFGYHIYAAAAVARLNPEQGCSQWDRILLLIRDIANPSDDDEWFPLWRHKDWFLGSSWASGIVKHEWGPDPHGRNQESISEAVNAYDAIALYGDAMITAWEGRGDHERAATARKIRDTGRIMVATEVEAAKNFWQVCDGSCGPEAPRIYPLDYHPKVVGQVWSTSSEMQTWFGSAAWKVYGIQLMPQTAISETLWNSYWVTGMLSAFNDSCESSPDQCIAQGWSTLSWGAAATLGGCHVAWDHVTRLPDSVYTTDGGNGQSKTNALWWIATRCP